MYQHNLKFPVRFEDEEEDEPKENPLENFTAAAFGPYNKKFLEQRKIFFWGVVHDNSAKEIVNKLLYLDAVKPGEEIKLYINSPGGSVYAGLGVYDTMQYVSPDVATICIGMAASMACVLLGAGTKGKRAALKHSRIMMHQPIGAIGGQASDIEITVNEIRKLKKELYEVVNHHTEKSVEQIEKDFDRDKWMTAIEAKEYGLVDEVLLVNHRKEKKD